MTWPALPGALGLVLHYLNSCITQTSLQQIFGLVPATVEHYIHISFQILDKTLLSMLYACVVWPNVTQISHNCGEAWSISGGLWQY